MTRNAPSGQRDESPKSNYYWPLEQRGYKRSGCTVSHWLLWSPGLVYQSPGWPPVAWQPGLSDGPASCWRGRFPPAMAVCRCMSGGDTRTGKRRRSLERRWQTFCPVWMPGRSLLNVKRKAWTEDTQMSTQWSGETPQLLTGFKRTVYPNSRTHWSSSLQCFLSI